MLEQLITVRTRTRDPGEDENDRSIRERNLAVAQRTRPNDLAHGPTGSGDRVDRSSPVPIPLLECRGEAGIDQPSGLGVHVAFRQLDLVATLPGVPLYRACGFTPTGEVEDVGLADGVRLPCLEMSKRIDSTAAVAGSGVTFAVESLRRVVDLGRHLGLG
jgi:hypothetical protein